MKLGWNAIVKNERAVIERCVESLLPHIDCAVVVDTGSTDGTQQFLMQKFEMAGKPLKIYQREFHNFAQARNDALRLAREGDLDWDYLLLSDADMDFVVEDPTWTKKLNGGPSYDVKQVAGALEYYNRRLVNRSATGMYECPTHEFLDVPTAGIIKGVHFIDHADGANRPEKTARDIVLLEEALKTETRPGLIERIHFYLASSYFDAGEFQKAAEHYRLRTQMGGFEEERWYAQMQLALCLSRMGDRAGFLLEMLRAYHMRPQRAEVLYELAKDFRERGENHSSLLFSEAGMQVPYPKQDSLFVNNWIYTDGLKEEFAICAYYDERKRRRGGVECNKRALAGSEQARSNLFWYLQPLGAHVPSFHFKMIDFKPPDGFVACNPSVIEKDGQPLILVRTVNYTINKDGGYDIRDGDGACSDRHPIRTRNFLTDTQFAVELQPPENLPEPQYHLVRGFEDSRLFEWCGELWTISCVRELNSEGWCEQVRVRIDEGEQHNWKKILPKERRHEKNWMPWVRHGELRFVYRLGHVIGSNGEDVCKFDCGFDVSRISGGSQVVQVDERTWLAIVHEAGFIPGRSKRYYQHRFVSFHSDGRVDRISVPFFFHDRTIEFCAGLAYFPEKKQLAVSYGINDCEAWLAWMDVDEVVRFIYKDAL